VADRASPRTTPPGNRRGQLGGELAQLQSGIGRLLAGRIDCARDHSLPSNSALKKPIRSLSALTFSLIPPER
jgi:hypothetical protein